MAAQAESPVRIERWDLAAAEAGLPALSEILADCVCGGASVNFMLPFDTAAAERYWRRELPRVGSGEILLLVARENDGSAVGTVQLHPALRPNQDHRADVAKLLVHGRARGRGVAAALMAAVEQAALELGRPLLVLDTVPGTAADRLYRRLGWQAVGSIPGFARMPDGPLCDTTLFYKWLRPPQSVERQSVQRQSVQRPEAGQAPASA